MKRLFATVLGIVIAANLFAQSDEELRTFLTNLSGKWSPEQEWSGGRYDIVILYDGQDVYFSYTSLYDPDIYTKYHNYTNTKKAFWDSSKKSLILTYKFQLYMSKLETADITISIHYQAVVDGMVVASITSDAYRGIPDHTVKEIMYKY